MLTTLLQVGFTLGNTPPVADFDNVLLSTFKFFLIVGSFLYILFSVVVVRQVHIMKNTLITTFSPVILMLGYIHLLIAIGVFFLYLLIL